MIGTTELLGLPGSGKTSVASRAEAASISTALDWSGPPSRGLLPAGAQLMLTAPVLGVCLLLMLLTRTRVSWIAARRLLSVQRRYVVLRSGEVTGKLLDEGPVHALYIALYGTGSTWASRFMMRAVLRRLSTHVDGYLVLRVSKEECIRNFQDPRRTSVRFNASADEPSIRAFRDDQTYDEILAALARVAPLKITFVNNERQAMQYLARSLR